MWDDIIDELLSSGAHIATHYETPKWIYRATRTLSRGKIIHRGNLQITLTEGRPNYREREFIKLCKKDGASFPISQILDQYSSNHKPSYKVFNEVIGVIECVKLEFYRKVVSPYEDAKESENGHVYTCCLDA